MLLLTLVVGVSGCSTQSPSDTVEIYFEEVKKGENGDFSKLLNENLNESENKEDFSDEASKKLMDSMKKLTYTINSEKIDGDSATVNVKVNGPDMATVVAKYMQEVVTMAFSQAFSGNQPTEEESDKLYNSILLKYLEDINYTDRTEDISLTKKDGQWQINDDDALSKLILNIDSSFMNSGAQDEKNSKKEIKEMTLNQPLNVETEYGNYILTIEGARETAERNEFSEIQAKKVAILDYSYQNISFGEESGEDLYIDEYAFQVLDDEGNVLDSYPVSDGNRMPKDVPVGGKCKASATFAIPTDSKNLNVTFVRGTEKVAKIKVPVQ